MRKKKIDSPFGKNLKAVMTERSLSVRGIAEIAGVGPSVVQDWLSGTNPHDYLSVSKISHTLKIDFQWLLTGTHSQVNVKNLSLSEIFDVQPDPSFSGMFIIEAKRIKKRGE